MVGYQKSRVEDPSDSVIDSARVRECTMSALVGKNPDTSAKQTLYNAVQSPCGKATRLVGDLRNVDRANVAKERNEKQVAENIGKRLDVRALVALGRNSIEDLLDAKCGSLESISEGVNGSGSSDVVLGRGG